ncbi:MAG: glycosyltransferase family 4 protein [Myxococcales bacterium]|nr:glycosyltransferase family 4 protein [Myxococcales bacterium]
MNPAFAASRSEPKGLRTSGGNVRRVLMTTDAVGGVWNFCLALARHLAARGVRVLLAIMGPTPTLSQRRDAETIPGVTVEDGPFALEWMERPWLDVDAAGAWLLALAERFRPDVVHLNQYAHGHLSFRAPVVITAHSCVLSWWRAVKGEAAPARWNTYRWRVARGLRAAHTVTAPSATMLGALQGAYGPLPGAQIVYNGLDGSVWVPRAKEELIVAVGRVWDEGKNLCALDRACRRFPWRTEVMGPLQDPLGRSRPLVHARAVGVLPPAGVAERLARAAIFCSPSLYEPFGLGVLEAALSGCALALADIGSFRELWGGAAAFFDPRDPEALGDVVEALIRDEGARRALGEAAHRRAVAFAGSRWATRYHDIYAATAHSFEMQKETNT